MNRVSIGRHCYAQSARLDADKGIVANDVLDEGRTRASSLKGVRICTVSSTAVGGAGGRGRLVDHPGRGAVFTVTKGFHNALQGGQ